MPCILKIRIVAARNLPVMDRATDLTDAFVEVKFADYEPFRTGIYRKSLNPVWNEDFRFEVSDDSDLQNEPLAFKIMDYDQITYNDSIGTVFIDLNPLLTWDSNAQISGWFPIYDTLFGVRGELNAQVRLQFFGDMNPFKDSSAGVHFYSSSTPCLPPTYAVTGVLGFVTAIDNEDDPEYHWSDNFRTPRKSNEARTLVMFQLAGHIRRQLGKKVLELGGNAVLGFKQSFDLESEKKAITVRAVGTAVKITARAHLDTSTPFQFNSLEHRGTFTWESQTMMEFPSPSFRTGMGKPMAQIQTQQLETIQHISDHDLSESPKGIGTPPHAANDTSHDHIENRAEEGKAPRITGLVASVEKVITRREKDQSCEEVDDERPTGSSSPPQPSYALIQPHATTTLPMPSPWRVTLDPWLMTLDSIPSGAILGLGGLVSATSVKVLDNDERDIREAWWAELRDEIKSHAKTLHCPFILGYTERTSINEDLVVLHCSGTAALMDLNELGKTMDYEALTSFLSSPRVVLSDESVPTSNALDKIGSLTPHQIGTARPSRSQSLSTGLPLDVPQHQSDEHGFPSIATTPVPSSSIDISRRSTGTKPGLDTSEAVATSLPTASSPMQIKKQISAVVPGGSHKESLHQPSNRKMARQKLKAKRSLGCRSCHLTYPRQETPFPMALTRCQLCRKAYVPEIVLSTTEIPPELSIIGKGVLVEAYVCRPKKPRVGESRANVVSEAIPFAQYDLHRQLMYKLRIHGLNAIFGLKIQFTVGENIMTAVATGTAVYARALPQPPPLKVLRNLEVLDEEDETLMDIQRKIMAQSENNRKLIELELEKFESIKESQPKHRESGVDFGQGQGEESDDSSSSELSDGEESPLPRQQSFAPSSSGGRQTQQRGLVVQIDDEQDEDLILFLEDNASETFQLMSVERPPAEITWDDLPRNFQMVSMIKQSVIDVTSHHPNRQLANIFKNLYHDMKFQLSCFYSCVVVGIHYEIALPKDNAVQISLTAMAIGDLVIPSTLPLLTDLFVAQDATGRSSGTGEEGGLFGLAKRQLFMPRILSTHFTTNLRFHDRIETNDNGTRSSASSVSRGIPEEDLVFSLDEDGGDSSLPASAAGQSRSVVSPDGAAPSSSNAVADQNGTVHRGSNTRLPRDRGASVVTELTRKSAVLGTTPDETASHGGSTLPRSFGGNGVGLSRFPTGDATSTPIEFSKNVEISPLSYIPFAKTTAFLGRMTLHFIKESTLQFDNLYGGSNGMGGFLHEFTAELYAIVRAHVVALGGNAITSFAIDQQMFAESMKNQGYALLSVSGDVVKVEYDGEAPPQLNFASELFERPLLRF